MTTVYLCTHLLPQEILQLFETPLVFRREEGTVVLQEQETILDKLRKRLCQRPFLFKKESGRKRDELSEMVEQNSENRNLVKSNYIGDDF